MILGDSIAIGIAQHKSECVVIARVGITSENWYKTFNTNPITQKKYKVVVISLGNNDYKNTTAESLYNIRKHINADIVFWIAPSLTLKPIQRLLINELANEFKDKVIESHPYIGYDGIHPNQNGYKDINKKII
jgi:lysophospholipase L1-like esterase